MSNGRVLFFLSIKCVFFTEKKVFILIIVLLYSFLTMKVL